MEEIKGITGEVLKVHGIAPGKKGQSVNIMIYEKPNGFNSRINRNEKLEKSEEIIDELESDVVAYRELRINSKHKDNRNGFSHIFRGGEADI